MRNIPTSEITQFLSELATLLQSSHSCQEALTIIQYGQDIRAVSHLIATVHHDVEQGLSLTDSLAKYPQYLEPFLVTMLRNEENLATTLFKIVEYREAMAVSTTHLAHRLRIFLSYFLTVLAILLPLMLMAPLLFLLVFAVVTKIVVGYFPSVEQSALTLSEVFITYGWLFGGSALLLDFSLNFRDTLTMRNIPASDITQFLSKLATLLQSNPSCREALKMVQHGQDNRALSQLIASIHRDIEQGLSLADSLAKYPQYVEPFLVTMLRNEENLATTLFKIAEYREAMAVSTTDLAYRLRTSISHFVTVFAILLTLMALVLIFVIPVFADMFKSLGGNLPAFTQFVLNLSDGFIAYWWLISGSAVIIGGWWWIQRRRVILYVPLVGRLYRKIVLVRFLRTCAFMLSNHTSLVEALQASAQVVHNPTYAKFLRQLTEQVIAGTTLAEALLKQPAFPAEVAHAAAEGTQVNQLDKQFIKLAEVYTQRLYRDIAHTIEFLEPIAMLAIGVLVGGVILAMYMPFLKGCEAI